MAQNVDALAAVTIAVQKAIDAQEIREEFLERLKEAYGKDSHERVDPENMSGEELVAIVSKEAGLGLDDVLETVSDVWEETERVRREGVGDD